MNAPRHDLYAGIHKGLRAFMSHVLVRVGRLDPHDPNDVAEVAQEVRALLAMCASHLLQENTVIHPAMEARRPGSTVEVATDHGQHEQSLAALESLVARLEGDDAAAQYLYRGLAAFIAHNLEHMDVEETHHNAVLWETHTDDELRALHERILSGLTPQQLQTGLRWIVPHVTPLQRAGLLAGMRRSAPPQAFEQLLATVRPLLGGSDWRKLSAALVL